MARYGVTVYGTDTYGELAPLVRDFDADPFTVVATGYGVAQAKWQKPSGNWSQQVLVRSTNGIPEGPFDGTLLLQESNAVASHFYSDSGLTGTKFYYYALYLFNVNTQSWVRAGSAELLAISDAGYGSRLFYLLPETYRAAIDPAPRLRDSADPSGGSTYQAVEEPDDPTSTFLYRFLSVFGFQLSTARAWVDTLLQLGNARVVSERLLPGLAAAEGITYEPELPTRNMRLLAANAAHIYKQKGTLQGARELANVVTGWISAATIGRNIALDRLDAGPDGGQGRWVQTSGAAGLELGYRDGGLYAGPQNPAYTGGVFEMLATGAGTFQLGMWDGDDTGYDRYALAVPVVQGRSYCLSQYFRNQGFPATSAMRIVWLDKNGNPVGTPVTGTPVTIDNSFTDRPFVEAVAPTGVVYLEPSFLLTSTGTTAFQAGAMQIEEGSTPTPWQCAREVIISLFAERINEVLNPTARAVDMGGKPTGWDNDPHTTLTSTVVGGDSVFRLATDGASGNAVLHYGTAAVPTTVPVATGETWTLSAEVFVPIAGTDVTVAILDSGNNAIASSTYAGLADGIWVPVHQTLPIGVVSGIGYGTGPYGSDPYGSFSSAATAIGLQVSFHKESGNFVASTDLQVRKVLLEKSATVLPYFDGDTPSPTGDYLWEGDAELSRSHFYSDRTVKATRLRALLAAYLPNGSCSTLRFAIPRTQVFAVDTAIDDYSTSPGPAPPPPPVGHNIELLWENELDSGKSLGLKWDNLVPVSASLALRWDYSVAGRSLGLVWGDLELLHKDSSLKWNDLALLHKDTGLVWNVLQSGYGDGLYGSNPYGG